MTTTEYFARKEIIIKLYDSMKERELKRLHESFEKENLSNKKFNVGDNAMLVGIYRKPKQVIIHNICPSDEYNELLYVITFPNESHMRVVRESSLVSMEEYKK